MKFTPITKDDILFIIPLIIFGAVGWIFDVSVTALGFDTKYMATIICIVFVLSIFYQSHTDKEAIAEYNASRGVQ